MSAGLIHRELNVSLSTLQYWRNAIMAKRSTYTRPVACWHRPPRHPNGRFYSPMRGERRREALLLYANGLNDYAIAEQLGITRQQAWEWRNALGLPKLEPCKAPANARPKALISPITPLSNALHAHIMQAIGRDIAPDMADDAASDMWLAIAEGTLTPADIAAQAKRYRNGVLNRYAGSTRSLDEDLTGNAFRMLDMLKDASSSDWLEEMGATVW